jgi:hypothetical protein
MTTTKTTTKSNGREAYRLWYEFLKRALSDKNIIIDRDFYNEWGEIENTNFKVFWQQMGDRLLSSQHLVLGNEKQNGSAVINIQVPMSLTPTQAANELRALLIEYYEKIKHTPKAERSYAISDGSEIKVSNYRAYLRAYDIKKKLLEKERRDVTNLEVLNELRIFYLKRTAMYAKTNRKVESMPIALRNGMSINPLTNENVNYGGEQKEAVRAVKRYLEMANSIIKNVAIGKFPK